MLTQLCAPAVTADQWRPRAPTPFRKIQPFAFPPQGGYPFLMGFGLYGLLDALQAFWTEGYLGLLVGPVLLLLLVVSSRVATVFLGHFGVMKEPSSAAVVELPPVPDPPPGASFPPFRQGSPRWVPPAPPEQPSPPVAEGPEPYRLGDWLLILGGVGLLWVYFVAPPGLREQIQLLVSPRPTPSGW